MALPIGQDRIVQNNVVRAQDIVRNITERGFDLERVRRNAHEIYLDCIQVIRSDLGGSPLIHEVFTPVMIELNRVTAASHIQHNLYVLIPLIKAHRIATELTWTTLFRKQHQRPTRTADRDDLIRVARTVAADLRRTRPAFERGVLISPAGARYEVACLEQAAKCLTPTESVWERFSESIAGVARSVVSGTSEGILGIGGFLRAVTALALHVRNDKATNWYLTLMELEWQATTITTLEAFREKVGPSIEPFIAEGGEWTLGLVKVLSLIFSNRGASFALKDQAFKTLVTLMEQKPVYSVREALRHPGQVSDLVLNRRDRYADTRSFAAMALIDIAGKEPSYRPRVADAMWAWEARVRDRGARRYEVERAEAAERVRTFTGTREELRRKMEELEMQMEEAVEPPTRSGRPVAASKEEMEELCKRISDEMVAVEEEQKMVEEALASSNREVAIADEFAAIDDEETALLEQILPRVAIDEGAQG